MVVQTNRKELFYNWLLYLDPILKLNYTQRKILASLITLHYYHRHRYSDEVLLNETLFEEQNLISLKDKLKIQSGKFNKALKELEQKGLIETNPKRLSQYLTQYPRDSKFKIQIDFKIVD